MSIWTPHVLLRQSPDPQIGSRHTARAHGCTPHKAGCHVHMLIAVSVAHFEPAPAAHFHLARNSIRESVARRVCPSIHTASSTISKSAVKACANGLPHQWALHCLKKGRCHMLPANPLRFLLSAIEQHQLNKISSFVCVLLPHRLCTAARAEDGHGGGVLQAGARPD